MLASHSWIRRWVSNLFSILGNRKRSMFTEIVDHRKLCVLTSGIF